MRAIILAAGMGTRLRAITLDTPKPLIKVNNRPLIETQIEYLNQIGVTDITVVVGYLAEKFDYLKSKYGVTIIFNEFYDKYNNIYTMKLVIDRLANSYVIDADIFITHNFLLKNPQSSFYFSGKKDTTGEWALEFDENNNVFAIYDSNGSEYIMSGVSFWSDSDAKLLQDKLIEKIDRNPDDWANLYWDDIVKDNLSLLNVKIEKISTNAWYEIDSLNDYDNILKLFPNY